MFNLIYSLLWIFFLVISFLMFAGYVIPDLSWWTKAS